MYKRGEVCQICDQHTKKTKFFFNPFIYVMREKEHQKICSIIIERRRTNIVIHENFKKVHIHTRYKRIFGGLLYPSFSLLSQITFDLKCERLSHQHHVSIGPITIKHVLYCTKSSLMLLCLFFVYVGQHFSVKNVCMMQFITSFDIFCVFLSFHATYHILALLVLSIMSDSKHI